VPDLHNMHYNGAKHPACFEVDICDSAIKMVIKLGLISGDLVTR